MMGMDYYKIKYSDNPEKTASRKCETIYGLVGLNRHKTSVTIHTMGWIILSLYVS